MPVLYRAHFRVYMVLLEVVQLRAMQLEVDGRAVLGVVLLQLRVHALHALAVALEDRVLKQQPERRHLRNEHRSRAVQLSGARVR